MNINFTTIDIIKTTDNNLYGLEINSEVCTTILTQLVNNGVEIVKDIYRQAIKKYLSKILEEESK